MLGWWKRFKQRRELKRVEAARLAAEAYLTQMGYCVKHRVGGVCLDCYRISNTEWRARKHRAEDAQRAAVANAKKVLGWEKEQ